MYSAEEAKRIRNEFWEGFRNYTNQRRKRQGVSGKWMLTRTGINALNLRFHIDQQQAQVGIDLETSNMDKRLELFEKLESTKKILHNVMSEPMIWEVDYLRENGKSVSRIYLKMDDVNIYDTGTWKRVYRFFFEKMDALESYYRDYQDFLRYS